MILSVFGIPTRNTFADEIIMNPAIKIHSSNSKASTTLTTANHSSSSHSVSSSDTASKSTNSAQKIPSARESWDFNNPTGLSNNQIGVSQPTQLNMGSLQLTGQEYIKEKLSSTENLSALSISVWVKPDYSHGSPQLTAVSKEKAFLLAINKSLPPTKKAVFSLFDGIKWNTITSESDIPQQWTNLVATFNGSSIALYVNGKLESSTQLVSESRIAVDGHLGTKTIIDLSSNPDIVIGTYYNSLREIRYNSFSGYIANANLYELALSSEQISQLYTTGTAKLDELKSNSTENHTG